MADEERQPESQESEVAEPEVEAAEGGAEAVPPQSPQGADAERAEEYRLSLLRLKADFDNYRRRVAQDQARWGESAVAAFVVQLLSVVDNLERALTAATDGPGVRQGVELTLRQLHEVLQGVGITAEESVGKPFDPTRHEAVAHGPAAGVAEGSVAEEYRKGYRLRDQVLRAALVKVATAAADNDGADAAARQEGEH